ncbi:hypothetical protein AARAC_000836 [Aspergillus arachidicola]|uniref:Uncharacterized protein n=1 Tax=Aspergillus arachidicola TaxID=656916 RepID=A0A2G7G4E9_9EURO|nr:hypothetical protein AARAC_000836 [Aspergillus arachidicola]
MRKGGRCWPQAETPRWCLKVAGSLDFGIDHTRMVLLHADTLHLQDTTNRVSWQYPVPALMGLQDLTLVPLVLHVQETSRRKDHGTIGIEVQELMDESIVRYQSIRTDPGSRTLSNNEQ